MLLFANFTLGISIHLQSTPTLNARLWHDDALNGLFSVDLQHWTSKLSVYLLSGAYLSSTSTSPGIVAAYLKKC